MCQYTFYITALPDEMITKLQEFTEGKKIKASIVTGKSATVDTLEVSLADDKKKLKLEEELAHIISDIVQKRSIEKVCDKYLKKRDDIEPTEKHDITDAFIKNNYLSRQEGFSYITYYLLYLPIYKEIGDEHQLNIDGWINFRVSKYVGMLEQMLERFVTNYLSKKDVVEFIEIMREASTYVKPLEDTIHLAYILETFQIFDKDYRNITTESINRFCKDIITDEGVTREDLILHVIMTISPAKIVFHNMNPKAKYPRKATQLINTLEMIYEGNISYCDGCDFFKCK